MKKIIKHMFGFWLIFTVIVLPQKNNVLNPVLLKDVNSVDKKIPFMGNKVLAVFYIDPDVQEINEPLADALESANYPKEKFATIAVINCKDTWFPNSAIRAKAKQKQERFPKSVILLDEDHILADSWKPGETDGCLIAFVIGKDSKIKFKKTVKSKSESRDTVEAFIKSITDEINK